jgi:hypothetical protein
MYTFFFKTIHTKTFIQYLHYIVNPLKLIKPNSQYTNRSKIKKLIFFNLIHRRTPNESNNGNVANGNVHVAQIITNILQVSDSIYDERNILPDAH